MNTLNLATPSKFFTILLTSILSTFIYLFLVFNDGLIGYLAVFLMIFSYIFSFYLSMILFLTGLKENSTLSIGISITSSSWVFYGLGSEYFSNGIDFKIMIGLLLLSIMTNYYGYRKHNYLR
jgi:hypothetical protein